MTLFLCFTGFVSWISFRPVKLHSSSIHTVGWFLFTTLGESSSLLRRPPPLQPPRVFVILPLERWGREESGPSPRSRAEPSGEPKTCYTVPQLTQHALNNVVPERRTYTGIQPAAQAHAALTPPARRHACSGVGPTWLGVLLGMRNDALCGTIRD